MGNLLLPMSECDVKNVVVDARTMMPGSSNDNDEIRKSCATITVSNRPIPN